MHDIQNKVVLYDIRKKRPKIVSIFIMIQNYYKFSRWNAKFSKIYTLWKIHIYSTDLTQNMWYIGATICIFNNKL